MFTSARLVKGPDFVNSDSDTVMMSEQFTQKHHLSETSTSLAVGTVCEAQVVDAV